MGWLGRLLHACRPNAPSTDAFDASHPQAGVTTLMVAHRLSTVVRCTAIATTHRGRVVERGSHAELLAANGYYAHLWHTAQGV